MRDRGCGLPASPLKGRTTPYPETSVPVLSITDRGEATVLLPSSPCSWRDAYSAPKVKRGSMRPTCMPHLLRSSALPTRPTWPVPPSTNLLAVAPLYIQPDSATAFNRLMEFAAHGVTVTRAA